MKTILLWKSLRPGLRSLNGHEFTWKIGEWKKEAAPLSMCNNGFHASENVIDAMSYVRAAIIARVEVRGAHLEQSDKQCWEEMRIVKAWKWDKADSVALAIFAARLVLPIWEKRHPDDKRVRNAIETAERYARGDAGVSLENLLEARKAAAAAAAYSYEAAADASAYAADASADASAYAASASAAYAAAAASAATRKKIKDQCAAFVLARIADKQEIVP